MNGPSSASQSADGLLRSTPHRLPALRFFGWLHETLNHYPRPPNSRDVIMHHSGFLPALHQVILRSQGPPILGWAWVCVNYRMFVRSLLSLGPHPSLLFSSIKSLPPSPYLRQLSMYIFLAITTAPMYSLNLTQELQGASPYL